jgi:hypothetical protein
VSNGLEELNVGNIGFDNFHAVYPRYDVAFVYFPPEA